MASPAPFVPGRSAVLSMDVQSGIVSIYAKDPDFVARAASVLRHARGAGMFVIHVKVGFRPKLPEINSRNLLLAAVKASPKHQQLFEGAAWRDSSRACSGKWDVRRREVGRCTPPPERY